MAGRDNSFSVPNLADELEKCEIGMILELYRSLRKQDQMGVLKTLIESSQAPDSRLLREGLLARLAPTTKS
jgi:hypothetical protein